MRSEQVEALLAGFANIILGIGIIAWVIAWGAVIAALPFIAIALLWKLIA